MKLAKNLTCGLVLSVAGLGAASVQAQTFTFLDPGYVQQLVVVSPGQLSVAGVTMGLDGFLYTNGAGSGPVAKWNPAATHVVNGTTVYDNVATNSGVGAGNWGMAVDAAGGIYSLGSAGLYLINPTTLAGTLIGPAGVYGLAYNRFTDTFFSSTGNSIIETRHDGTTRTVVASVGGFADQVAIDPTGAFIAGADTSGVVRIWNITTGALVRSVNTTFGAPDGMGFDSDGSIFTNNTNGTVAKLAFGAGGYAAGAVTQSLIASGGFYGDLAGVGADGAFYLSQYGVAYNNGVIDGQRGTYGGNAASIVKLTKVGGGGFVDGGTGGVQDPGNGGTGVPEPSTLAMLALGLLGVGAMRRRRMFN